MPHLMMFKARKPRRYKCPRPVDEQVCQDVLRDVWDLNWAPTEGFQEVPPSPYIDFWGDCVQQTHAPNLKLDQRKVIVELVQILKSGLGKTPPQLCREIQSRYQSDPGLMTALTDDEAWRAFAFAARLWIHVSAPDSWRHSDLTLQDLINHLIPKPKPPNPNTDDRLEPGFSAEHLTKVEGFHVHWTDDICQHLELRGRSLFVFRHSTWLATLERGAAPDPFPKGFTTETLRTLWLLYRPRESKHARRNTRQMERDRYVDLELAMADHASVDLQSYPYWHERLREIHEAYTRDSYNSLSRYWYDRRDEIQWATFWMGLLVVVLTVVTVVFGVIQCVTAVVQVYAIYHPPGV